MLSLFNYYGSVGSAGKNFRCATQELSTKSQLMYRGSGSPLFFILFSLHCTTRLWTSLSSLKMISQKIQVSNFRDAQYAWDDGVKVRASILTQLSWWLRWVGAALVMACSVGEVSGGFDVLAEPLKTLDNDWHKCDQMVIVEAFSGSGMIVADFRHGGMTEQEQFKELFGAVGGFVVGDMLVVLLLVVVGEVVLYLLLVGRCILPDASLQVQKC